MAFLSSPIWTFVGDVVSVVAILVMVVLTVMGWRRSGQGGHEASSEFRTIFIGCLLISLQTWLFFVGVTLDIAAFVVPKTAGIILSIIALALSFGIGIVGCIGVAFNFAHGWGAIKGLLQHYGLIND